ncbi:MULTISPECIES: GNAT family N-acetyltransferase [Paenibacillus]|uniref:GNAT family N-acetyltransferase n=1 Tax=Paenibacillus TaxID=44249 RepID=UPI0022B8A8D1|nr:GNAT family N-acetyltransferase [Paenibacillus caseinilyticus]MCZ8521243.1 GNAT family N-acetyltransferase [Paenibacillus caseinilyticus]
MSTVEIRRLADCTLNDAVQAWNQGFSDYYIDIPMTASLFTRVKYGIEDIHPDHSFLAYVGGVPVGLLLNGIRSIRGRKVVWNGGTAVAPGFRRLGVGRELMTRTLEEYRALRVDSAQLEAVSQNERAIALYKQFGYRTVETLHVYGGEVAEDGGRSTEKRPREASANRAGAYVLRPASPREAAEMAFHPDPVPWQMQWGSAKEGQAVIAEDPGTGRTAGYLLYRNAYNEEGKLAATSILQCCTDGGRQDTQEILQVLLRSVLSVGGARRVTANAVPDTQPHLMKALDSLGLQRKMQQVHMACRPCQE